MPHHRGGISPTDFVSTLSSLIEAKTKENSAAGSPLAQRFYEGWCHGQAALAAQLDEPLPDDGSPLRKNAKRKDGKDGAEVREAAPSGGKRRGRRGAVAAARQHLGAAD